MQRPGAAGERRGRRRSCGTVVAVQILSRCVRSWRSSGCDAFHASIPPAAATALGSERKRRAAKGRFGTDIACLLVRAIILKNGAQGFTKK